MCPISNGVDDIALSDLLMNRCIQKLPYNSSCPRGFHFFIISFSIIFLIDFCLLFLLFCFPPFILFGFFVLLWDEPDLPTLPLLPLS